MYLHKQLKQRACQVQKETQNQPMVVQKQSNSQILYHIKKMKIFYNKYFWQLELHFTLIAMSNITPDESETHSSHMKFLNISLTPCKWMY